MSREDLADDAKRLLSVGHGLRPEGGEQKLGQEINLGSWEWLQAACRILHELADEAEKEVPPPTPIPPDYWETAE